MKQPSFRIRLPNLLNKHWPRQTKHKRNMKGAMGTRLIRVTIPKLIQLVNRLSAFFLLVCLSSKHVSRICLWHKISLTVRLRTRVFLFEWKVWVSQIDLMVCTMRTLSRVQNHSWIDTKKPGELAQGRSAKCDNEDLYKILNIAHFLILWPLHISGPEHHAFYSCFVGRQGFEVNILATLEKMKRFSFHDSNLAKSVVLSRLPFSYVKSTLGYY